MCYFTCLIHKKFIAEKDGNGIFWEVGVGWIGPPRDPLVMVPSAFDFPFSALTLKGSLATPPG